MRREVLGLLSLVLFLFALAFVVGGGSGCTPAQQLTVENAAAVAQYDQQLVACKTLGKELDSFAAFVECERELSRRLCASSEPLRREWPRCAEVTP